MTFKLVFRCGNSPDSGKKFQCFSREVEISPPEHKKQDDLVRAAAFVPDVAAVESSEKEEKDSPPPEQKMDYEGHRAGAAVSEELSEAAEEEEEKDSPPSEQKMEDEVDPANGSVSEESSGTAEEEGKEGRKRRARTAFSLCLTKEQIEEDILAVSKGKRVKRMKIRRGREEQAALDKLFPGFFLSFLSPIPADSQSGDD